MKTTESFKKTIEKYLNSLAESDPLFAETLKKPEKNLGDCVTYILNQVQKSGCSGFADEEIYSMAVHYYDEDGIEVGSQINCKVVVNHKVELSEEEIKEAKQKAIEEVISEEKWKLKKKVAPKKEETKVLVQASLF